MKSNGKENEPCHVFVCLFPPLLSLDQDSINENIACYIALIRQNNWKEHGK